MFLGIAFVLIGGGMLLQSLGYIPADANFFWSVILIALGLSLIFKRRNCCDWPFWNDKK